MVYLAGGLTWSRSGPTRSGEPSHTESICSSSAVSFMPRSFPRTSSVFSVEGPKKVEAE